ncbi:MAG: helix-turn-helix domain-containing protein [Oscillospiraceae bacterium]|jgi:transcriptional regulator with XRE-family HTH domain|nr:helix-turn-helix domain-containing protein [Oscillospiraceae bacterium]
METNVFLELRKQRGITQQVLARELGINQAAISQWERGRTSPDKKVLAKLSDYYQVSADVLLGRADVPQYPVDLKGYAVIHVGPNTHVRLTEGDIVLKKK